ncbi:hypothetical protein PIB30_073523, partial [Stylosanthes scabra]|nr:hypothetical protein [Stylosanthes scabra]
DQLQVVLTGETLAKLAELRYQLDRWPNIRVHEMGVDKAMHTLGTESRAEMMVADPAAELPVGERGEDGGQRGRIVISQEILNEWQFSC